MQAGHLWTELSPGVSAKVLDSSLAFHRTAAVWKEEQGAGV